MIQGIDQRPEQMDAKTVKRVLRQYEGRDHQLWSIVFMILVAVAVGFGVLVATTVVWGMLGTGPHATPLVIGFAFVVSLLVVHIVLQRRALTDAREALLRKLVRVEQSIAESFVDPLTGLFNRRYMDYYVRQEAKRADRRDGVFTLLMLDVDGFKTVNDRMGPSEGDRLLQQVAQVLRQTFRGSDTIVRYRGDEFVVLMPDTDGPSVGCAVRRLQERVDAWNEVNSTAPHTMSLACGATRFSRGHRIDDVMALLDRRLDDPKIGGAAPIDEAATRFIRASAG